MTFIAIPSLDSLVFDASSFISMHPALVNEISSHAIAHVLYSFIKKTCHRKGLNRREIRKIINRRNRWFVDNIIMHHKRLHDLNRQLIINNARKIAIAKTSTSSFQDDTETIDQSGLHFVKNLDLEDNYFSSNFSDNSNKNYENNYKKNKTKELIIRAKLRKKRARSRWIATFSSNFIDDGKDDWN